MRIPGDVRTAAIAAVLVAVTLGGVLVILFVLGLATRDTSTRCFANFKRWDRSVLDARSALVERGYEPRMSGSPSDKHGATLRVAVKAEFLAIAGVKDDQKGPELEVAMRDLIPDLSHSACSSPGILDS